MCLVIILFLYSFSALLPNLESIQYTYSIVFSVVLVKTQTLTLMNRLACIVMLLLLLLLPVEG